MRDLTISLDEDTELGLRIFMERTRTTNMPEAISLAVRAAALLSDPHWLGDVVQRAVRDIPAEEPATEPWRPFTS
jgi:hypothetical protein